MSVCVWEGGAGHTTNATTKSACLGSNKGNISMFIAVPVAEVTCRSVSIDGKRESATRDVFIGIKQKQVWIETEQERCLCSTKCPQSNRNARCYHYQASFLISLRCNYFH